MTSEDWNAKHGNSLPDLGAPEYSSGDEGSTGGGPNASQTVALPDRGGIGGLDGAQVHQSALNGGGTSPECSFLVQYVTGGVDVDPSSGPESGWPSSARYSSPSLRSTSIHVYLAKQIAMAGASRVSTRRQLNSLRSLG